MAQSAVLTRTDATREWMLAAFAAALVSASVAVLYAFGSAGLLALAGIVSCVAAIIEPRVGVYGATIMVLGVAPLAGNPSWGETAAYVNKPIAGISLLPVELVMLCASAGVLRKRAFTSGGVIRSGELWLPLLALASITAGAFVYGISQGGKTNIAVWETRGIFVLVPIYYVVTNSLTERRHFQTLAIVGVGALLFASCEALYRHFTYIRGSYDLERPLDLAFAHESAIFAGLLTMYFVARALWGSSTWTAAFYAALALIPLAALVVMRRRAGMIALDVGLMLFALVLFRENLLRFFVFVPLALTVAALTLAVTWNEPGGLGQPARSVQEIFGQDAKAGDDRASNEYRERETNNVRANITARPIQGLGFGREYSFPNNLPDLSGFWPLFRYVPHNTVLWVWIKGGMVAFIALLTLFAVAMARSAQLFMAFKADRFRIVPLIGGTGVLMFAVFAYTDLGLVTSTAVFFFGLCLGLIGAAGEVEKRGFVDEGGVPT